MEHKISIMKKGGVITTPTNAVELGWNMDDIVGIVVQTPVIGLVVSIDKWEEIWGKRGRVFNADDDCTGDSQNLMDLYGKALTDKIIDFMDNATEQNMYAAKRCAEYKKGGLDWYLPSVYELCTIYAFKDEVRKAMEVFGITDEDMLDFSDYHWSSSENNFTYAVIVNFDSGSIFGNFKGNNYSVRAVSAFEPLGLFNSSHYEQSEQCVFDCLTLSDEQIVAELKKRGYSGELVKTLNV